VKPYAQDIEVYRGDFFSFFFRVYRVNPDGSQGAYEDLTGWTGLAQIRASENDASVIATFTFTPANQTTFPGGVLLSLDETVTETFTLAGQATSGKLGVWDVQLTNTLGEPNTYIKGAVMLEKDVSHA
jgi:hypothetical protein